MKCIVGLMSGTSLDGIDAALVRITEDDYLNVELVNFITIRYEERIRREILTCCNEKIGTVDKICRLNFKLGELLAEAALKVIEDAGMEVDDIDLIGSHGQTIYHAVGKKDFLATLQIGTGGIIAERTGVTTVSNFRVRDIAAGGEGAPLVPYVDYLLYTSSEYNRVLQNIGGIGNYTYLPIKANLEDIEGSDTGPGNMLIDGVISILSGGKKNYDKDGKWAALGSVSEKLLKDLMSHSFIKKDAPKTTGREEFGTCYARKIVDKGIKLGLNKKDIVTTVTAFTAFSIIDFYKRFIKGDIDQIIIGGGGSYNPTLVVMIKKYAEKLLDGKITVLRQEDLGFSSDAKEAIAFALLAYQTMKGRTNNVPKVTGANKRVVMGEITPGRDFYKYCQW